MKRIKKVLATEQKETGTLYTYLIDDSDSEKEYKIKDFRVFELGEKIHTIWTKLSDTFQTAYIVRLCSKCGKQVPKGNEVHHEFCTISHTNYS